MGPFSSSSKVASNDAGVAGVQDSTESEAAPNNVESTPTPVLAG